MSRPRLRTILLGVNLVLIALPLSGVWTLRLYESALVRQTESELIAQAAVIAAGYKAAWLAAAGPDDLRDMPAMAPAVAAAIAEHGGRWQPRFATLDLADDPVLPPPPDGRPAERPPRPAAARAGAGLQPVLHDAQRTTLAGIRILDETGTVVASTGGEIGLSLGHWPEVGQALAGAAVSSMRHRILREEERAPPLSSISRGTELRVFVAMPALAEGRVLGAVLVSRTPRSIGQALYGKRYHLLGLAVILLGAVVLLAAVTALTISRPLRAVMLQARRAAAGERSAVAPLARPGTREVADLSASLVTMARTLESRAEYIQGFAAEVSHEFKTPLSAMAGTLELLRDHIATMTAAERDRFIGNLEQDVARLNRLVHRLLELARADVMQPRLQEAASVPAVVAAVAEPYRREGLRLAAEGGPLTVAAGREVLEAVLRNLLDNVRQHGGPGVGATIAWRRDGAEAVIELADDGPGISPGNAPRVFDRFFTTARDQGGTGLGLAIVRSQLAAHGGSIALLPSPRGARFAIRLPLAPERTAPPDPGPAAQAARPAPQVTAL